MAEELHGLAAAHVLVTWTRGCLTADSQARSLTCMLPFSPISASPYTTILATRLHAPYINMSQMSGHSDLAGSTISLATTLKSAALSGPHLILVLNPLTSSKLAGGACWHPGHWPVNTCIPATGLSIPASRPLAYQHLHPGH